MADLPADSRSGSANHTLAATAGKLMLTLMSEKIKIVAVASSRGTVNSGFVDTLCGLYAQAGMKVACLRLHSLDAADDGNTGHGATEWRLTDGAPAPSAPTSTLPNDDGVARFKGPLDKVKQQVFNNPAALRAALLSRFQDETLVVLELGPVLEQGAATINPVAAASACDGVVMFYPLNCHRSDVSSAEAELARGGAKLLGSVLDETVTPNSLTELAGALSRWKDLAPEFAGKLVAQTREMAADY